MRLSSEPEPQAARLLPAVLLVLAPAVARAEPAPDTFATGAGFTRVTEGDLVTTPALYWGGSWGDYDGDGWLDLFVGASVASTRNFLFHNERDGSFARVEDAAMPKLPSNQHGAVWGDYDNDGDLDLVVTAGNPGEWHNMLYRNAGDGTFSWVTDNPIYTETRDGGFHGPVWGDYDDDGFLDLFIGGHDTQNRLFRNDGAGSFTRIADHALVNVSTTGVSFGSWTDYDADGDRDLLVANTFVPETSLFTNVLYRNEPGGVYTRVVDRGSASATRTATAPAGPTTTTTASPTCSSRTPERTPSTTTTAREPSMPSRTARSRSTRSRSRRSSPAAPGPPTTTTASSTCTSRSPTSPSRCARACTASCTGMPATAPSPRSRKAPP